MDMVVSQRKIKETLRTIIPPGTHIREGVLDAIQVIMAIKLLGLCNRIVSEAEKNTSPLVLTRETVMQTYGEELLIVGGSIDDFSEIL